VENFGGDLELKLDLTWSGQVDSVDLTAATLRSNTAALENCNLTPKIKPVKPGFLSTHNSQRHKPGFTGLKIAWLPGFSGTRVSFPVGRNWQF